ncbi:MAG: hypothetical protein IJJ56_01445 [Prevotella sp.]|nr:hypothetical protein [Prevotella sp.]
MVQAKNYKNKEEVIADFRRAFARKRKWLEEAEKELMTHKLLSGIFCKITVNSE